MSIEKFVRKIKICKNITIEPKYLGKNINKTIQEKIQEYDGTCKEEYGYIVKIYPKFRILENKIGPEGIVMLKVEISVSVFKPQNGDVFIGEVCMILENGLFVGIYDDVKVLVSKNKMKRYKYDSDTNTYRYGKKVINVGDKVKIKIEMSRYDCKGFEYIGILC